MEGLHCPTGLHSRLNMVDCVFDSYGPDFKSILLAAPKILWLLRIEGDSESQTQHDPRYYSPRLDISCALGSTALIFSLY